MVNTEASMSQTERIFYIDRQIRETGGVSVACVVDRFEVCERQVKRDIEYMRDRLGAPIVWTASRHRYEYSESWDGLRFADETSFFAFVFLRAILDRYAYVPVVSEEITELIKEKIAGRYAAISDKVRYELPDMETIDGGTAYTMCQALLESRTLNISYTDARGETGRRVIAPQRLINYAGKWYCVAFDSRSRALRIFAVSRIQDLRPAEASGLPIPPDDEIERYISSSYGIFKGEALGTATLRFYGGAARAVRAQQWHEDQKISGVPSAADPDTIDLSLPAHDWTELLGRALRCGANCEVMGPPEFRARWVEEIKKMREMVEGFIPAGQ